jgi:urease accessory protein
MQHRQILRTIVVTSTACVAALSASTVLAHTGVGADAHTHAQDALSSFTAGATHPLTGLDHLAAMVAVGCWSALSMGPGRGRQSRAWAAPAAFAITLLLGALIGMAGLSLPGVEPMIAASLLVLGLLVATRAALPTAAGAALVAMFALFHGVAHGSELGGHALASLAGMVLSTATLHAAGIALGLRLRDQTHAGQRWAARLAGLGITGFGLSLMTPAIAASF